MSADARIIVKEMQEERFKMQDTRCRRSEMRCGGQDDENYKEQKEKIFDKRD